MTDSYPVRRRVRELAKSYGWRLRRFRLRGDGRYDIVIEWDPIYVTTDRTQQVQFVSELNKAVTVVRAYLSGDANVVWMPRR